MLLILERTGSPSIPILVDPKARKITSHEILELGSLNHIRAEELVNKSSDIQAGEEVHGPTAVVHSV